MRQNGKKFLREEEQLWSHIIAYFILVTMFFHFYFLYHVLVKLQNKENFSDRI